MADDEFTQRRRQDLARKFLAMVQEEFERKLQHRNHLIERAAFYGLEVSEISELVGLTEGEVLEVLRGRDAA